MLRQPNGQCPLAPYFPTATGKNFHAAFAAHSDNIDRVPLCAAPLAAEPLPRTVLVLDQSTPYTEYFGKLFASFQSTLKAGSDIPITIDLERLGYSHFKGAEYDSASPHIHQGKVSLKTYQRHCRQRLRCSAICSEPANRVWIQAYRSSFPVLTTIRRLN